MKEISAEDVFKAQIVVIPASPSALGKLALLVQLQVIVRQDFQRLPTVVLTVVPSAFKIAIVRALQLHIALEILVRIVMSVVVSAVIASRQLAPRNWLVRGAQELALNARLIRIVQELQDIALEMFARNALMMVRYVVAASHQQLQKN